MRQRPGTANGVLFMTLEDETGQVNVILCPGLLEKFRKEALGAALLAVYGLWQAEGKVRHLIARIARGASNIRERVLPSDYGYQWTRSRGRFDVLRYANLISRFAR
ncbi:Error-prone DNA polymerase [Burkholderia multivorans]|nr:MULTISPECIES: hypothetical protein [Burkholderia cepacia complex]AIO71079.1 putative error-prone DNA polymerase [Burkholderia multivorans]MDR8783249.1 Error-prone DNA polymerase [Burkholderia multivorans]MDR8883211.1 Error-prone DNA polymerase [Burkholderia multivorans]MDR8886786.1 Error-prone DNA polymerase [Burkholderia multivorans]MDR8901587.1 Error-prone DNA polymerase [Burkholderia multivorans]